MTKYNIVCTLISSDADFEFLLPFLGSFDVSSHIKKGEMDKFGMYDFHFLDLRPKGTGFQDLETLFVNFLSDILTLNNRINETKIEKQIHINIENSLQSNFDLSLRSLNLLSEINATLSISWYSSDNL